MYAVMPAYNEIDGVPAHVNDWLLEQVLRREWGFHGPRRVRLLRASSS